MKSKYSLHIFAKYVIFVWKIHGKMAKLKPVVLKNKSGIDGTTNIKIRLTHDKKSREIATPHYIRPEFMGSDGRIKESYPGQNKLNISLNLILNEYNVILAEIGNDIAFMDINTVVKRLKNSAGIGADFIKYANERIRTLTKEKRLSYATSYTNTIIHLKRYADKDSINFKEITKQFLEGFEKYLQKIPCRINTIKVYLVNIRAIFNHAIDNDIVKIELFPFRKFKVKSEKAKKRSLEIIQIKKLMVGPYQRAQQRSVDICMLIFYLAGINIKDLLYLKPSDYKKGRIAYKRAKTGGDFDIKVYPQAQQLIEKYKGERYLLNFLDQNDSYTHYKNLTKETNKRLRMASVHAGMDIPLSTYSFRHSFATIGRSIGVSFDDIKQALGHDQRNVTDSYINYDMLRVRVDEAQNIILNAILK